jgi:hypothetical protein
MFHSTDERLTSSIRQWRHGWRGNGSSLNVPMSVWVEKAETSSGGDLPYVLQQKARVEACQL